ncbi:unnamed protein product [Agarophyton chilense]
MCWVSTPAHVQIELVELKNSKPCSKLQRAVVDGEMLGNGDLNTEHNTPRSFLRPFVEQKVPKPAEHFLPPVALALISARLTFPPNRTWYRAFENSVVSRQTLSCGLHLQILKRRPGVEPTGYANHPRLTEAKISNMSTTSSEDKVQPHDNAQRGHHSSHVESNERERSHPTYYYASSSEPDRRNRRSASERSFDSHMQRRPRSRSKDNDSAKYDGRRRRTPSIEPSRSEGSRQSPAQLFKGARIGKRIRRRPQRWEGERTDGRSQRMGLARVKDETHIDMPTGESTVSMDSSTSEADIPVVDSPYADLRKAVAACDLQPSRRDMVDWFHSWQLRAVSKQAAQQKALHVFLKRRLRKRTTRSPEHDRMEQEALRNARLAIRLSDKDGEMRTPNDLPPEFDLINEDFVVPNEIRLPLEAYMPRRMVANGEAISREELLSIVPQPPQELDSTTGMDQTQGDKWMRLPTVLASAQWNSRKSNGRRRMYQNKQEQQKVKMEDTMRVEDSLRENDMALSSQFWSQNAFR